MDKNSFYSLHIMLPNASKNVIGSLVFKENKTITDLFIDAFEQVYGINLKKINKYFFGVLVVFVIPLHSFVYLFFYEPTAVGSFKSGNNLTSLVFG